MKKHQTSRQEHTPAGPLEKGYRPVSNNAPLECCSGNLIAFSAAYDVSEQIFLEEAALLSALPGLGLTDWAQGRLFDNDISDGPVVIAQTKYRY
ncbi:hypothetical protein ACQVWA_28220 [Bacillus cereus]|uniref:hypothetical protein n=1 Tax=Bacillus cereus TaxID=1396 RepID=UPI003D64F25E